MRKGESLLKQYVLGIDKASEQYGSTLELLAMARGRLEATGAELGRGEEVPNGAKRIECRFYFEGKLSNTYANYSWETVDSNGVRKLVSKANDEEQIEEIIVDGKEHEMTDGSMGMTGKYRAIFDGKTYHVVVKGLLEGIPVEVTYPKVSNLCQQETIPISIKAEPSEGEFQRFEGALHCRVLE